MHYTYVSGDIETLGLDPLTNKVVEIGFILDNSKHRINYNTIDSYVKGLPTFHCYVRHDSYEGHPYAVKMNESIINLIKENKEHNILDIDQVALELNNFFETFQLSGKKLMPAGKNFAGFDKQFLNQIPGVKEVLDKWLIHRTLDPSLYYFDENVDTKLPNLKECLDRANINKVVAHTAVEDAEDVIRLLRYKWDKSPYM